MKEQLIPIDHAGRIVLPKVVRDELAIKAGDTLRVAVNGISVTLTPNTNTSGFVRKGKVLIFSGSGDAVLTNENVTDILEASRRERELPCLGIPTNRKRPK